MSRRNGHISDGLYDYILDASLRDHPVLKKLRDRTGELPNSAMQISADQGQFMALLAKLIGARKTLEVGTFTGYSSTVVAMALPDDGKVVACDISEEFTNIAKPFWKEAGVDHKIDLRIGPGVASLDRLLADGEAGTFDMAFIDADKEGYPAYYDRCLALIRQNGLILIDNAFMGGRVVDGDHNGSGPRTVRALNCRIRDDERVDASLLSVGDGLYVARKR